MRGKRSKQYRKLLRQYELSFGFREPYQVIVDSGMVEDSFKFKMDLVKALERTVQGKAKPMITQCSIRHLYATKGQDIIALAKSFERRRCGHHELETPLSTLDCLKDVVDAKDNKTNKHRYIIASQDGAVRAFLRRIPGVPLIYIHRSVMILEPMTAATEDVRNKEERAKFRDGLKGRVSNTSLGKRSRDDQDDHHEQNNPTSKKPAKGQKGTNPLSSLKPKRRKQDAQPTTVETNAISNDQTTETTSKPTRKRKPSKKPTIDTGGIEMPNS